MDRLPECYQGPPADKLAKRYAAIRASYPIIKQDIVSYSKDLAALIRKMREGDRQLSNLFQEFASDTRRQVKAHNFKLT